MWRNGFTQIQITESVSNNKQMSNVNVFYIISKILRNIQKKHNENIIHVYETTKKVSSLKICSICGQKLPKTAFDKSYSNCKKCISSLKSTTKTCKKCGITKMPNQFGADKRNADGLKSWCKQCLKESEAKRRQIDDI
jgi:acyl-coenzyme A synthetase/AMP-(fatty) acid ligase